MTIEINTLGCQITVAHGNAPDGTPLKVIRLTDPQSGIVVNATLHPEAQAEFERMWHGLIIARPNGGTA